MDVAGALGNYGDSVRVEYREGIYLIATFMAMTFAIRGFVVVAQNEIAGPDVYSYVICMGGHIGQAGIWRRIDVRKRRWYDFEHYGVICGAQFRSA